MKINIIKLLYINLLFMGCMGGNVEYYNFETLYSCSNYSSYGASNSGISNSSHFGSRIFANDEMMRYDYEPNGAKIAEI